MHLKPSMKSAPGVGDGGLFDGVGKNLEDIERRDEIEVAGAKWDVADARLGDAMAVGPGKLGPDARQIESDRSAVGSQHLEIRAGAAPAVENPRGGHTRRGAGESRLHILAETAKPKVRLFRPVGQFE